MPWISSHNLASMGEREVIIFNNAVEQGVVSPVQAANSAQHFVLATYLHISMVTCLALSEHY